ncbi:MAG: hypothetical protein JXA04_10210 [Gammaproteobacteria bacterium]|nr:hypothetical protein [Gammaproteobacteria bacterium]
MIRLKLFTMLPALFIFTCSSISNAQPRVDNEPQIDANWKFDFIKAPSLESNLLEDEPNRLIEVYLPPSYNTSKKRYPTVYYLWGYNSQNKKNDLRVKEHKKLIDEKIHNNLLNEMIVVFISGSNRLRGSFYINSPVTGKWADFITKDVVEHIDKTYRTLAKSESRSIVGSSMGGFGALNLSMLYPDVFSSGYGLSPVAFAKDGFNTSHMVKTEGNIEKVISLIEWLHSLPKDKAHLEFLSFLETNTDGLLFVTMAYGAAYVPDPERPPYFKFPFKKVNDEIIADKEIWQLWQNGFGGIEEKVHKYKSNLEKLKVLGISVGYNEERQWLIDGCLYYSEQLEENRISHILHLHQGTHTSLNVEVLLNQVLPLFSNVMVH